MKNKILHGKKLPIRFVNLNNRRYYYFDTFSCELIIALIHCGIELTRYLQSVRGISSHDNRIA